MCYRMSEISRHPVVAATRALRFADHVTKRNEGSGNENGLDDEKNAEKRYGHEKYFSTKERRILITYWVAEANKKLLSSE